MRKIAIIANKRAGQEDVMKHVLSARASLWGRQPEFYFPESALDLQHQVLKLSQASDSDAHEAIVLIGGDGTLNQAIRMLPVTRNPVPIYVYPGGTANDLASELNLRADWAQVQSLLDHKRTWPMDLIEVNRVPFSTVAGIGVGALLTAEFNSRRGGSLAFRFLSSTLKSQIYTLLTAKTVVTRSDYIHHLHIRAPGFDEKLRTAALFVCNQARLGGNIWVAPKAENDDERFQVMIVTSTSKARLLSALAALKSGRMTDDFVRFSADQLTVTSLDGRAISVFGDGETLLESKRLEFRIRPGALNVFRDPRGTHREAMAGGARE